MLAIPGARPSSRGFAVAVLALVAAAFVLKNGQGRFQAARNVPLPSHEASRSSSRFLLQGRNTSVILTPSYVAQKEPFAGEEEVCEEIYGVLPCSTSIGGNLFLMLTYGYLVLVAAQLISSGSEMLLQVLDPGIIGGLLLPILGAMPDTLLVSVSGLKGTRDEAQEQVLVGMGVLAGSTIMILTIAWGGSLLCGRCDLVERAGVGLVAIDRTLTRPWDFTKTGVTTDEQTRKGAWIMVGTIVPFFIMQVPILLHGDLRIQGHWASLVGLIVAGAGLVFYCTYQVLSPWLQQKRMAQARMHYIRTLAVRDLHNLAKSKTFGALINPDGSSNAETLGRMFDSFDSDKSGSLSKSELKALILGLGVRQGAVPQEEELSAWLKEFDVNADEEITKPEFVTGMSNWMRKVQTSGLTGNVSLVAARALRSNSGHDVFWDSQARAAQGELETLQADTNGGEDDEDEEEHPPKTPMQIITDATLLIAAGAVLVGIFADPVVDTIGAFSKAADIPAFFVAFIACPLASNASELVSSLLFAMKKKKRTISLTYSQVYGAITMNNTLCLGAFLCLVFFRGLLWDFSAEVTVILFTTIAVGIIGGSAKTFPTWISFVVLSLYPLSLIIVMFLDYVLGWK